MLYQPSFCVPRNQSIDATNEEDMTFSWKLNGNNPLVAYNIQIYDNDTNVMVYELISTENERAIQAKILQLSNYIANQNNKLAILDTSKTEYKQSTLRSNFKTRLQNIVATEKTNLGKMEETLTKKKRGETLGQTEITKYFQYWENMITQLRTVIGDEENPLENTGEYILDTIENWVNIDPARTDGITYEDENYEVIDKSAFNKVKEIYNELKVYYESVAEARIIAGASDTTYINDTTLSQARQAVYLKLSEYTNESYFGKDLYESVNKVWLDVDFDKLETEIVAYNIEWFDEIEQQEYALAHLNGGKTTQAVNVYNSPTASSSNIAYTLPKDAEVAVITAPTTPPSGWAYISSDGRFGYIQTQYVEEYDIQEGKYYLLKPIYPTNYEGEQNTVYHQLPINILENGKDYKWSVTLYWSTSGKYNEDDKIDGKLVSVENYFNTRKRPEIWLDNYMEVFSIPFNYVTTTQDIIMNYTENDEQRSVSIPNGSTVRLIQFNQTNPEQAYIEYIVSDTNLAYKGYVAASSLDGVGLYETSTDYILPSKKALFVGGYSQEQYSSIAYFRWILYRLQYDSEEVVEVVKDTEMIPSTDFRFYYDGFLNDTKYAIKLFVQTVDNVEVETDLIKFKASYIDIEINNMVNAENSPIEHGIIVEWSNLRLINGEVEGDNSSENYGDAGYLTDTPTEGKMSYKLKETANLLFNRDKGKPLSIDWNANQIISTRFDTERPLEARIMYSASGLDDNGDVISKTLTIIPTEDTQTTGEVILRYTIKTERTEDNYDETIVASQLYWYVIIMKNDGFVVYRKYASGLFPALDQYPQLNRFTGARSLYPNALTYYDEPSEEVTYNYQTIVDRDGNEI